MINVERLLTILAVHRVTISKYLKDNNIPSNRGYSLFNRDVKAYLTNPEIESTVKYFNLNRSEMNDIFFDIKVS